MNSSRTSTIKQILRELIFSYQVPTSLQKPINWLSACFVTIISISLLLFILANLNRGYDFTDEGYYLANSLFFADYNVLTKFGFLNKPFLFFGAGVHGLRICGLACFVITSIYGGWALYRIEKETAFAVLFGAYSLLGFLCYYWWWIPTPSYNSYNVILIYLTAILLSTELLSEKGGHSSKLRWTLIGGLVAVTFFVKLTSACALGLLAGVVLLSRKKNIFKQASFACLGGIAVLLLFCIYSREGIWELWINYREAYYHNLTLKSGHGASSLKHLWVEALKGTGNLLSGPDVWWKTVLALFCLLAALWKRIFLCLFCVIFIWISAAASLATFYSGASTRVLNEGVTTISISLMMALFVFRWNEFKKTGFLWLLLPFVYWLGSNNCFWRMAYCSLPLFVGCGCLLAVRRRPHDSGLWRLLFIPFSIYLVIATPSFFLGRPYRQPTKLSDQNTPCELGNGLGTILVDEKRSKAIKNLQNALGKSPSQVVDLTGGNPGWIIAAGGKPVGVPWMIGGYPGAHAFTSQALQIAGKEVIAKSIIFVAENRSGKISPTVLKAVDLSLKKDYSLKTQFTAEKVEYKIYYPVILDSP